MDQGFEAALERALQASRARARWSGGLLLGVGLLVASAILVNALLGARLRSELELYGAVLGLAMAGAGGLKLSRHPAPELERLRGSAPTLWAPSPTHGVVVVAGTRLLTVGLAVELDRHAEHRVSSVSYDDAAHALQVQTFRLVKTRDGEREVTETVHVGLDRSLSPERGLSLARELLALSAR